MECVEKCIYIYKFQVEPMALAVDALKLNQLVEKKFNKSLENPTGSLLDFSSMYPAMMVPNYSFSNKPVEYTMCPVGGHKTLRGILQCTKECDRDCIKKCSRRDKHVCKEAINCFKTCSNHFPPSDWCKLPGFCLVKILPPKDKRFPVLRMRIKGDKSKKNFSTLCRTCAIEKNPFHGLSNCNHSDEERALFGEFTSSK